MKYNQTHLFLLNVGRRIELFLWLELPYISSNDNKAIIISIFSPIMRAQVVYLCIIFYSMHFIFALPGWRHKCILKRDRFTTCFKTCGTNSWVFSERFFIIFDQHNSFQMAGKDLYNVNIMTAWFLMVNLAVVKFPFRLCYLDIYALSQQRMCQYY